MSKGLTTGIFVALFLWWKQTKAETEEIYDGGILPHIEVFPEAAPSHLDDPNVPFGIRNNNPLNVRDDGSTWLGRLGTNKGFVQFRNMVYGARCGLYLLRKYINTYRLDNINSIVRRWAPVGDGNNNPEAYAISVERYSGINRFEKIVADDKYKLFAVFAGMCEVENGTGTAKRYITTPILEAAWKLL